VTTVVGVTGSEAARREGKRRAEESGNRSTSVRVGEGRGARMMKAGGEVEGGRGRQLAVRGR
jgi:hypothetical protein